MPHLIAIIDEYKDAHGSPSDSSIARAIGSKPQTISSWRNRGIRELPETATLERLAAFVGRDYLTVVLPAALRDIGAVPDDASAATLSESLKRITDSITPDNKSDTKTG